MPDTAIKVENLSKRYRIGRKEEVQDTFVGALKSVLKSPFRNLKELRKLTFFTETNEADSSFSENHGSCAMSHVVNNDIVWALKNVSFEVKSGEVVGLIGRNGAGKSTLLKILSRITEPTSGRIIINGRVSSLLEVGTGFHPDLTGSENVYLNGTLLGMSKQEVDKKFDEIIAFAEVEKFIDTPIKRYSSGMTVRLAFAVAAHLEPEILLVDEVLAVGDIEFQKKCLGKMDTVAKAGRTVIFVSHNLEAIRRLCRKTLLLSKGCILLYDENEKVINKYLEGGQKRLSGMVEYNETTAPGDDHVRLYKIRLTNKDEKTCSVFYSNENIKINISFYVLKSIANFHTAIRVYTYEGILVFASGDWDIKENLVTEQFTQGYHLASCIIPGNLLNSGTYNLRVSGLIPDVRYIYLDETLQFEINEVGSVGGIESKHRPGIIRPSLVWDIMKQ